ncbi:MAG: hypothetical protein GXO36_06560 [Chloroflexi bacterium]|nr:hypothetical protein [Chloroflexota bacterium]
MIETRVPFDAFFRPRGIAVIGASTRPTSLGYAVARNLLRGRHGAAVYLVNPKGGELFGQPLYPSVAVVPDPVDLAVLVVPAQVAVSVMEEVGQRGIQAAIIQSGGFAEEGPEGAARQRALVEVARRHGLRVLGPNCIGILDLFRDLNTTFLPPPLPRAGGLAFYSQSGALAAALLDWGLAVEQGFSRVVSTGNQADLTLADLLPAEGDYPPTRAVLVYSEDAVNTALVTALRELTRHKPAIVLQAGRTAAGQQAAASHTAALASPWDRARAGLRRAGALAAEDLSTARVWAQALVRWPEPSGDGSRLRVAILTNAGGPGVLAADAVGQADELALATLRPATQAALREGLPPAASVANPVDMLATASPEQYARSLATLLQADEVDAVVVLLPPPPGYSAGAVAKALIPVLQAASRFKPVTVALLGGYLLPEARAHLHAAEVPTFSTPEDAVLALVGWVRAVRGREHARAIPRRVAPSEPLEALRALLAEHDAEGWLAPRVLARLLDAYELPRVAEAWARTPEEAVRVASKLGYPVVLKLWAEGVVHKSAAQGVRIGLSNAEDVRAVVEGWHARFGPRYRGVLVQTLAPDGPELIVGGLRDSNLGPLVLLGLGGVAVEAWDARAFALAPLTVPDLDALLAESRVGPWLAARAAASLPALRELLVRVASLLADLPLAELDLNPVRITPTGPLILDARARVMPAAPAPGAATGRAQ